MKIINCNKIFLFSLIFGYLGNSVFSQTLWQNAQYSMTVTQIRDLYPSAYRITDPDHLILGADEGWQLNDFEFANEKYNVNFYFVSKKLIQVTLTCNEDAVNLRGSFIFDTLNEIFTARYGKPFNFEKGSFWEETEWYTERKRVKINLLYYSNSGDGLLNINYQIRDISS
jgi:hypothetical protein